MWNGSVKLPTGKTEQRNKNGFPEGTIYTFLENVPASFNDATRNDEILASQKGYTVDQNIEIMACNYHGQTFLVDESNGDIYDIKRTYRKDKSMKIVLTCQKRVAHQPPG